MEQGRDHNCGDQYNPVNAADSSTDFEPTVVAPLPSGSSQPQGRHPQSSGSTSGACNQTYSTSVARQTPPSHLPTYTPPGTSTSTIPVLSPNADQQSIRSRSLTNAASSPLSAQPPSKPAEMPRPSHGRPPSNPRRSRRSWLSLLSSSVAHTQSTNSNSTNRQAQNLNAAFLRALQGRSFDIPNDITRFNQQLKYIKILTVPQLKDYVPELQKLFLGMLALQVNLPSSHRFHSLLETEYPSAASSEFKNIDLFRLFSSTVSTETRDLRNSVSIMVELLVDFKLICNSEGSSTVPPQQKPSPAPASNTAQPSSRAVVSSGTEEVNPPSRHNRRHPFHLNNIQRRHKISPQRNRQRNQPPRHVRAKTQMRMDKPTTLSGMSPRRSHAKNETSALVSISSTILNTTFHEQRVECGHRRFS